MTAATGPDGIRPGDRAGRRYLGLWLPTFPLDRIERRLPAAERGLARVTVAEEKGALRLVAVNRAAAALGLASGLSLADARARHPTLAVAPAAPMADAALLGRLADAGERYTPLIACDGPDGLMLDVTGCAHLFGGEKELGRDLLTRLREAGLAARAALAATTGAAFAFSRFGPAPAVVVPAGAALGPLLAPLPVAALRLDGAIVAGLARLGLRRIGDLMDKPRAPLAARFGALVLRRLEEALGTAPSALAYRFPPPVFCAERRLMEPVERVEDVLGLAGRLAAALAGPLEQRGLGARRLDLVLFRVDGRMTRLPVGARRPLRDPDAIVRLFAEKVAALGVLDAGFGFDLIRLAVAETAPLAARQAGFGSDDGAAALDGLIDRLAIRFGATRVRRLVCADHHLPEAAGLSVAAQGWSPPADRPDLLAPPEHVIRPARAGTGDARDGAGRIVRMHAGSGGRPEAAAPEQVGTGAETGAGWIIPVPAGSGCHSGAFLPASAGSGGAEDGGGPVAPMRCDCAAARVEGGAGSGAAGPFRRCAPAVSSLQDRLLTAGGGPDGMPASPEGGARGRILPFPATAARSPDAGKPTACPEAPPALQQPHLRRPPDERPASPAAGAAGEAPAPARADPERADICGAARPLRLFAPPEPVEAVAEVPDGPPLRFRWRRRVHRVIRVEGPERIGGAWWAGDARARDYFRVETEEGCRFWLFRTDPPEPEPTLLPRTSGAGAGRGAGPEPADSVAATDMPPLAFPRPGQVPGHGLAAFSSREGVSASLENALRSAPPQAGRPGGWFLHGVLG